MIDELPTVPCEVIVRQFRRHPVGVAPDVILEVPPELLHGRADAISEADDCVPEVLLLILHDALEIRFFMTQEI